MCVCVADFQNSQTHAINQICNYGPRAPVRAHRVRMRCATERRISQPTGREDRPRAHWGVLPQSTWKYRCPAERTLDYGRISSARQTDCGLCVCGLAAGSSCAHSLQHMSIWNAPCVGVCVCVCRAQFNIFIDSDGIHRLLARPARTHDRVIYRRLHYAERKTNEYTYTSCVRTRRMPTPKQERSARGLFGRPGASAPVRTQSRAPEECEIGFDVCSAKRRHRRRPRLGMLFGIWRRNAHTHT